MSVTKTTLKDVTAILAVVRNSFITGNYITLTLEFQNDCVILRAVDKLLILKCTDVIHTVVFSPITGLRCPEGFRKLRFPDYVTMAQDGGKVVSLMHWPFFTPSKIFLVLVSVRG